MTATISEDVQQRVLAAVRKNQEITLRAINQAVESVNAATEKLPALPLVGKLPQLSPLSELPGAHALPAPERVVSATFDFVDRLLAEERKFAGELVKATASLRPAASAEPVSTEPVSTEPVSAEPAKAEHAKAKPAKAEHAKAKPADGEPAPAAE